MGDDRTTTTASEMHPGGDKPGTDYSNVGGIGTDAETETTEGGGEEQGSGSSQPDDPSAAAAQEATQSAYE